MSKRFAEVLKCPRSDGSGQTKDSKYLVQGPQNPEVVNIRNNKSTANEGVDHVSSFLVNLDSMEISQSFGDLDSVEISGEFPDPPEIDLEFSDD